MKIAVLVLIVTGSVTLVLGRIGHDDNPMLWLAGLQFLAALLLHVLRKKPADRAP